MWLYGASGHGKVIKEILESQGRKVDGFIDDNPNISEISGLPVIHTVLNTEEIIVSIGVNPTRKRIVERLNIIPADAAVHPSAVVSHSGTIGGGSVVMAKAVLNADTRIGKHSIINTGATVDHDCIIGDFVHIAPGVHICGLVNIGEGTMIGVGTSIKQCVNIGKWCVIGAGSVVLHDIPDGYLAYGNPCKLIRLVNQDMF